MCGGVRRSSSCTCTCATQLAAVLGDDQPDLDLRAQAGPAILLYQASICGEQLHCPELAQQLTELMFARPTDG